MEHDEARDRNGGATLERAADKIGEGVPLGFRAQGTGNVEPEMFEPTALPEMEGPVELGLGMAFVPGQERPKKASPPEPSEGIVVLLPAFNEEGAIGGVIKDIRRELGEALKNHVEILVIDGHSTDKTREIANGLGARIITQPGRGKGDAVISGLHHVDGRSAIVMLDADGSYPAREIPKLLERLRSGADIVIGSRLDGSIESGAMSDMNYLGNRLLSTLANLLYGARISDVCSGMWAMKPEALRKLTLNSRHFELEAELFAQASKAGLRIEEVPIHYKNRIGDPKLVSCRCGLSIAMKLLRKRFVR